MPKRSIHALLLALAFAVIPSAHALTADQAQALAVGESDARVAALQSITNSADERTVAFIRALADDAVKLVAGRPVIVVDDKAFDPVTGGEVALPDTAEEVMNNNRMRGEIDNAIATVSLMSPDVAIRRAALETLRGNVDVDKLPLLEKALAAETVPDLRSQLAQLRAAALLSSGNPALRLKAATLLGESDEASTKTLLVERLQTETDQGVKVALQKSLSALEARLAWGDRLGRFVQRNQLGQYFAAGGLGAGDYLWPHGRDQHGPRGADDDWCLCHLRGAGSFPEIPARRF